jgi:triphosphatase
MEPAANRELELKFVMGPDDLARAEAVPELQAALGRAGRHHESTIYFDTPDQDLWKRGFSLRIRKSGDRFVETIKQETASLITRGEWEKETNSATLDLRHAEGTPIADFIGKRKVKAELRPAFEVNVERRVFTSTANGAVFEGVVDTGHIDAGGEKLPVHELELELKSGDFPALFGLARAISANASVTLCVLSKAERGFRLAAGTWGRAAKGSNPRLSADMTCKQAFQEICRTCLHDFMLNAVALDGSDHVEGVHQARVATRRLRATLTLFEPIIRDDALPALSDELRWLATLLGAARDLDVMRLESGAAPPAPNGSTADLEAEIRAKRAAAYAAVRDGFASPRYRTFLIDFVAWIEAGRWRTQQAELAARALPDFVVSHLRKRRKKLVTAAQDLAGLDPQARHRIRIKAKKLRYIAEFFREVPEIVVRRKAYKSLIAALEDLQEALGEMHDIEVRNAFHARVLVTADGEERGEAAAGYVEAAATDTSDQLARAIDAYERLAAAKPF